MGNYYALELFSCVKRQIFFSEKGLPPSELLTVFRRCDRAYPSFPSGFEESDEPYIPSHAYVVSVPKLAERLEVMGFTLPRLEENVERCLKRDRTERDQQIEHCDQERVS
jgi:HEPN/Toprim N-terminal domain 1